MKNVNDHALHGGVACQLCHNAHGKKLVAAAGAAGVRDVSPVRELPDARGGSERARGAPQVRRVSQAARAARDGAAALRRLPRKEREGADLRRAREDDGAEAQELRELPRPPHVEGGAERVHAVPQGAGAAHSHAKPRETQLVHELPRHPRAAADRRRLPEVPFRHEREARGARSRAHKDCTSCHNPHAPRPEDTRTSCAKCHTNEVTQVMGLGPEGHAKTSCFGCHQPHENPLPAA